MSTNGHVSTFAVDDLILGHRKHSDAPDVGDPGTVVISDWNDTHVLGGGANGQILTRDTTRTDGAKWADAPTAPNEVAIGTDDPGVGVELWVDTDAYTPTLPVPTAHWVAADAAGTGTALPDRSGNGRTGTLTGGCTWETVAGEAAVRCPSADYVSVPDSDVWTPTDFTWFVRLRFNSLASVPGILSLSQGGGLVLKWVLEYSHPTAGRVHCYFYNGGEQQPGSPDWSALLNTSAIFVIVARRTGSTFEFRLYTAAGALLSMGTSTNAVALPNAAATLKLGWGGETFFNSDLSLIAVRMDPSALTETQITDIVSRPTFGNTRVALKAKVGGVWADVSGEPGPTGATGPQGPPGLTVGSFSYRFNNATSPPPLTGRVRFNNADPASVTQIYVHEVDQDAINRSTIFMLRQIGEKIRIEDASNAAIFAMYTITAAPVDSGVYITFTVAHYSSAGALADNAQCSIFFGSAVTAPLDAQYLVLALDAALTGERRLAVGSRLTLTDGGAGGDATLDVKNPMPGDFQFAANLSVLGAINLDNNKALWGLDHLGANHTLIYMAPSDAVVISDGRPVYIAADASIAGGLYLTQQITMENAKAVQAKDSGGTVHDLLRVSASDRLQLGEAALPTQVLGDLLVTRAIVSGVGTTGVALANNVYVTGTRAAGGTDFVIGLGSDDNIHIGTSLPSTKYVNLSGAGGIRFQGPLIAGSGEVTIGSHTRLTAPSQLLMGNATAVCFKKVDGTDIPTLYINPSDQIILGNNALSILLYGPVGGTIDSPYAARAWGKCTVTGGTLALVDSVGISGVSKTSTGIYVITWSRAFPDANYAVFFSYMGSQTHYLHLAAKTTTTCTVNAKTVTTTPALVDPQEFMFVAFGK